MFQTTTDVIQSQRLTESVNNTDKTGPWPGGLKLAARVTSLVRLGPSEMALTLTQ